MIPAEMFLRQAQTCFQQSRGAGGQIPKPSQLRSLDPIFLDTRNRFVGSESE